MLVKLSHQQIIHLCDLELAYAKAPLGCGALQTLEQDDEDMKLLKMTAPLVGALSLAACMDGGGAQVTMAQTPASSCGYLQGISQQHLDQIGNIRCGPQAELPYTFAN